MVPMLMVPLGVAVYSTLVCSHHNFAKDVGRNRAHSANSLNGWSRHAKSVVDYWLANSLWAAQFMSWYLLLESCRDEDRDGPEGFSDAHHPVRWTLPYCLGRRSLGQAWCLCNLEVL